MGVSAKHEVRNGDEAPLHSVWPRRLAVILLGALLGTVVVVAVFSSFVQGSWWYADMTDTALDSEQRANLAAIRDELESSGLSPRAVMCLDAALAPNVAPTTMRNHLIEARDALDDLGGSGVARARQEIDSSIALIRSRGSDAKVTLHPLPTLAPSE